MSAFWIAVDDPAVAAADWRAQERWNQWIGRTPHRREGVRVTVACASAREVERVRDLLRGFGLPNNAIISGGVS